MRSVCAALGRLLQDGADGPNGRRSEVGGPGDPGLRERWLEPVAYESVEHLLRLPDVDNAGAPTLHWPLDVQDLAGRWCVGEAKLTKDRCTLLLVHARYLDEIGSCHWSSPFRASEFCPPVT